MSDSHPASTASASRPAPTASTASASSPRLTPAATPGAATAVSWEVFAADAPELAAAIRERFAAHKHHVMATLRGDGSPRVSGTEVDFRFGKVLLGSMPGARKARDLQRDPRLAVHAHTGDSTMAGGDAKIAGRAVEILDAELLARFVGEVHPPEPFHLFDVELTEAILTTVEGDQLVVRRWAPGPHGGGEGQVGHETTVRR
jgi:hypothetical protein